MPAYEGWTKKRKKYEYYTPYICAMLKHDIKLNHINNDQQRCYKTNNVIN